jgi:ferredoxin-NADP reductase
MDGSDVTVMVATSAESSSGRAPDFHALEVMAVIQETSDTISIVFEVPAPLRELFTYRAGQFVTLRTQVNGNSELRSYSMSSAPRIDSDLQVTVKRVAGGLVSNWLIGNVRAGDRIDVSAPTGSFVLPDDGTSRDVLAFAAGSGITPILSIIKYALADTDRAVRLFYASSDRSSVIFHESLQLLESKYAERLRVIYSLDEDSGYPNAGSVADFLGSGLNSEFYVCGPKGFMDVVTTTLVWCGARNHQLHREPFTPDDEVVDRSSEGAQVTVTLGERRATITHRAEWTLVQAARAAGLKAPSSCHLGQCGTCMARVTEGRAEMTNNQVLSEAEVAEGWVLTCQARPVTPKISVVYES